MTETIERRFSPAEQEADLHAESWPVRAGAHILSYIFHPLFIPVYLTFFLLFMHPLLFTGYDTGAKWKLLITVFVNLCLFPAITVFLCWRLKFIDSIRLSTQKERIIPLAATMIFYFWGWYVLRSFDTVPDLFKQFLLGSFLTIIGSWLANIYFKVSLHALGIGGLVAFMAILVFGYDGGSAQYLAVTLILGGLVCSARLALRSHRPFEIYGGLLIGILCQLLADYL